MFMPEVVLLIRAEKFLVAACMFPAEVEWGGALLSCFSSHTVNKGLGDLLSTAIFSAFC
jgi:hypothetical protein